jgi:phosphopantetheinyl transferase
MVWTEAEERRWRSIRAPLRAAQYRTGRWLLRHVCSLALDLPVAAVSINAEGAPRAQGPQGATVPALSLAHSGDVVVAVASEGVAGIDVEVLGLPRDWPALARRYGLGPGAATEREVLRAWTLKEARFKAGISDAQACTRWRFQCGHCVGCLVLGPDACAPEPHAWAGAGLPSWAPEL